MAHQTVMSCHAEQSIRDAMMLIGLMFCCKYMLKRIIVLDSGQLHQSEKSWVRFLDGPLKNCQASGQSRGHVSSGWTRKNTIG